MKFKFRPRFQICPREAVAGSPATAPLEVDESSARERLQGARYQIGVANSRSSCDDKGYEKHGPERVHDCATCNFHRTR